MGIMAESFIKSKNETIKKRKRKKKVRNAVLSLILFVSILATLALKLSYFNITVINVTNNKNVTAEEIIKLSNIFKGNNIFYINSSKSKTYITKNPYILDVDIKRKFPSTITINVKEREAGFYCMKDKDFLIIDKSGVVLQEVKELTNPTLVNLMGFDVTNTKVGDTLSCDDKRKLEVIEEITELITSNNSSYSMNAADLSDLLDIKVFYGNMCVKLGTSSNLKEKLNKAINIMSKAELKDAKGYVDVRFNSMPVYYIEN